MSIRDQYKKQGVANYYKEQGGSYQNPHFAQVRELLIRNQDGIDYSHALDFCCGSGEVSQVLTEMGFANTTASDPYTSDAYSKNFAQPCLDLSFEAVIRGQLSGDYSAIICSFAMHLCPSKQLYPLCWQLFQRSSLLIIITPHKRPALEKLDGIYLHLEDFALTERGKKVRLKGYRSFFSY